jgi:hypothetical protein
MVVPLSILDASGTTDTYFVRHSVSCDQRGALLRVLNEAVTMPLVAAIFMITYLLCGLPCWLDKRLLSIIYLLRSNCLYSFCKRRAYCPQPFSASSAANSSSRKAYVPSCSLSKACSSDFRLPGS